MRTRTLRNKSNHRNASNRNAFLAFILCAASIMISLRTNAQDSTLKVHYTFEKGTYADSVTDNSGNGCNGALKNGATVRKIGRFNILDLGSANGYLDMGKKTGTIIKSLSDFSIALNVYVDQATDLSAYGNFIWTFAKSDDMANTANGNMFFSAKETRYAISPNNWLSETTLTLYSPLTQGAWQHIAYTQSGNTGTIYINGIAYLSGTIQTKPSTLGATTSNYLGKSCYASDVYLQKSMLNDFQLYSRALTAKEVVSLASQKAGLDSALVIQQIEDAKSNLILSGLDSVKSNLTLPTSGQSGVVITWSSDNVNVISKTGVVTRPASGASIATVKLTATLSKNGFTATKEFIAYVIPFLSDRLSVKQDSANLILYGTLNALKQNLILPVKGFEGSTITWSSNKPDTLSNTGSILNYSAKNTGKTKVILTATLSKGSESITKTFEVYIVEADTYAGYLFVYFTNGSEAIHFALSDDGYNYKALNKNNPVLSSSAISSSGGVRDPHIFRGEDGNYYMVATDMVSALGWDSNRAMVLLKSSNLTDWKSSVVNIPNTYPEYSSATQVWAPQTIYDPTVGKYMIYYAMRLGTNTQKIYYAYANSDFTKLEASPKVLYEKPNTGIIDPDIILKDGIYHLFFKNEINASGLQKAISSNLTGGYAIDNNANLVQGFEGSCVFKQFDSNTYIMMINGYVTSTSTDLENFYAITKTASYDFYPVHGTVMPITVAEKQALNAKWGTTGIESISEKNVLAVYPNPVKDILHLSINENNTEITATIYNLTGKELISKTIQANKAQIDVSGLPSGIYVICCKTKDRVLGFSKFIVL
ncbi:immunoglobulin-like domain-containing protein [Parabacteroides sp. FAFU027]|uniref:immunoglobulin-like domain-containing protein n=1 Tax=Parabacteroides sp. FAFU027 TaxID=2922715 RepID=UPI001FAF26AD|nr:immunoglobulin-like domain-containing protein [Parabacteroides sp. FAFU027]